MADYDILLYRVEASLGHRTRTIQTICREVMHCSVSADTPMSSRDLTMRPAQQVGHKVAEEWLGGDKAGRVNDVSL